jgi:hypothetical protein
MFQVFILLFVLFCGGLTASQQTGTWYLAKRRRKAKERNIHHGLSAVKTSRVLRARTNIAHLYPTKTTRSSLSATVCVISILLWVALLLDILILFPNAPFGFLESPWNGRRQTETHTIIEICSSPFYFIQLCLSCFPLASFISFFLFLFLSFDFVLVCLVILLLSLVVSSRLVYLSSYCASRVTVDS